MNQKSVLFIAIMCAMFTLAPSSQAGVLYKVTEIKTLKNEQYIRFKPKIPSDGTIAFNNNGQILGNFTYADPLDKTHFIRRPYTSFKGIKKEIPVPSARDNGLYGHDLGGSKEWPPRNNDSIAIAINDKGQIIGNIDKRVIRQFNVSYSLFVRSVAAVTINGVMTPLLGLNVAGSSYATAINNKGQIVGWANMFDGEESDATVYSQYGFVTINGKATNLNNLINEKSGWILLKAYAINDNGQIIGEGVNMKNTGTGYRELLLTPIKIN